MVFRKGKVPHQSNKWPLEEAMERNKEIEAWGVAALRRDALEK
jgi:hypothetical protein